MADKKFVAPDGIQIGAFTVDPATGDLTTTGNITIIGGGSFIGAGSGGGAPTPAPTPTPTPSPAPTPAPGYSTALLLPMDSANTVGGTTTTPDDSASAHTVTLNGAAAISSVQSKFGSGSIQVAANAGYVSVPSSSEFDLGTGDFTIEAWVYITSNGGDYPALIARRSAPTYPATQWSIALAPDNTISSNLCNGSSWLGGITGTTPIVNNEWTHVALARQAGNLMLFINGQLDGTQSGYTFDMEINTNGQEIRVSGDGTLTGFVDDLRITNGAAVYTSNFTPPAAALTADSNTVLLCHFDSSSSVGGTTTTPDYSGASHTATLEGNATLSTAQSVFGGGSIYFDGLSRVAVPQASNEFQLDGAFTAELWIYPTAVTENGQWIQVNSDAGTLGGIQISFKGSNEWGLAASGQAWIVSSSTLPALDTWNHVAVVRNSNNDVTLYLNGLAVASINDNRTFNGDTMYIGSVSNVLGFNNYLYYLNDAYIDDLRIVKGYAVYTANFTPPAAPLTAISG